MTPAPPPLTFFAHLSVHVDAPYDLGEASDGHRRLVPLTGGRFAGPDVRGTVLRGGTDNQVLRTATLTELDAQYALETDEGERIAVHNTGIRSGSPEDIAAIVRGEEVAPERIYFRSFPRLATAAPRLAWLNERLFVATGERRPDSVELDVFLLG
ncbi:DUF3237 domain-containing protein [Streptomyces sp. S465]|uniref:DUF3237 domain-containing protein n=1 Tax=Streptomyces sp. S465 TaxID=2979468 RepID=UPI0022A8ABBA|nr:DUF3237 domain-containing protein [Streptomyces sp. S465]WAP55291.1 DUF3237 domain-containing protein [Streptomyces sp. S465]